MATTQRKADLVYDQLKLRFLAGEFRFGERLTVNDLGVSMGTSRQPVLEAIKRLQDDGLVEVTPQVGSHVVIPPLNGVADFFEVFATLESLVTRFAAERREPGGLGTLEAAVPLVGDALEGGDFDLQRYLAGNRGFHGSVHQLARSAEAVTAAERFWDRSDFLIASLDLIQMRSNLSRAVAEHQAIYEAIADGDGDRAADLACAHVRGFASPVTKSLRAMVDARYQESQGDGLGPAA
ncbi:MAG: transcriptional regulator [Conexibacter sp.]|nr:transcriptional regulator [Conexibacter sp.]